MTEPGKLLTNRSDISRLLKAGHIPELLLLHWETDKNKGSTLAVIHTLRYDQKYKHNSNCYSIQRITGHTNIRR